MKINREVIQRVISDASDSSHVAGGQKVSIYSSPVLRVLRCMAKMTPGFTMSGTASEILEEEIAKEYPELWAEITKFLPDSNVNTDFWKHPPVRVSDKYMEEAYAETSYRNGRMLPIYNPRVAAVMRYMHFTTPQYQIGKKAVEFIGRRMAADCPDTWAKATADVKKPKQRK